MYKFLFLLIISFTSGMVIAQVKDPVKWTTSSTKKGDNYDVILTATLPRPWHIYSQKTGEGPLPTKFTFAKNPLIKLQGDVKEVGKLKEEYDKNFDSKVKYFAERVDFVQTLKVPAKVKTNVAVTIEYMTCDDKECLPPTKKTFNVALN